MGIEEKKMGCVVVEVWISCVCAVGCGLVFGCDLVSVWACLGASWFDVEEGRRQ